MAEARERLLSFAFVLMSAGALGFLYLYNPSASALYPTCPFLAFTGCYCPGCGSLRALHQLMRGHLAAAFGLNTLMVFSVPFIGYFFLSLAKFAVVGRPLRAFFIRPVLIWSLLVVILAYWILRNIPVYPFSLLAP